METTRQRWVQEGEEEEEQVLLHTLVVKNYCGSSYLHDSCGHEHRHV